MASNDDDLDIPEFLRRKPGEKRKTPEILAQKTLEVTQSTLPINQPPATPSNDRAAPSYNRAHVAEIEGMIDDGKTEFYEWMIANQVGPLTLRHIISIFDPRLEELKSDKKEFDKHEDTIAQYTSAIDAAASIIENKRRTRKPRTIKKASVEKLVKNVKYTEVESVTKIASILPGAIIGKTVLWAFDCSTRMLKLYRTKDAESFSFKSTALENCDLELCVQKKVRKPETILPKIVNENKATVLGLFKGIKAVESKIPTMRTNQHFVFLRVF